MTIQSRVAGRFVKAISKDQEMELLMLDELEAGDYILDRDLKGIARDLEISLADAKSALKRLVRDGDAYRESNGWRAK